MRGAPLPQQFEQLRQGEIVWAMIPASRGPAKKRPIVIYTPSELIGQQSQIGVVGITTSYYPDDPDYLELPWRDDGRITTRLRKPSAISFRLLATVEKSTVEQTGGYLDQASLINMLRELKVRGKLP